jgi:outer membrane usher protein
MWNSPLPGRLALACATSVIALTPALASGGAPRGDAARANALASQTQKPSWSAARSDAAPRAVARPVAAAAAPKTRARATSVRPPPQSVRIAQVSPPNRTMQPPVQPAPAPAVRTQVAQPTPPRAPALTMTPGRRNPTNRQVRLVGPIRDGDTVIGEVDFALTADDKLLVGAPKVLEALQPIIAPASFVALKATLGDRELVPEEEYKAAGYEVSYDTGSISIRIKISAVARPSRTVNIADLDRGRIGEYASPARLSAYLNARSTIDYVWTGPDKGPGDLNVFLDGAIRYGSVVFESDGSYAEGAQKPFRRETSRFVFDELAQQRRWIVGDLQPTGRGFVGSSPMAGISVLKSFSLLEPQRNVQPRGEREFTIERTSTLDAIINGRSVRKVRLEPGTYKVRDFPFGQGLNDVNLVIEDDFGQKESIQFSLFFDRSLLSEGLSEYGAFLGVLAQGGLDGRTYDSSEPVFSGFYRRGIRPGLTLGTSVHARSDGYALGGETTWASSFGTLGADAAISDVDGIGTGYALNMSFQRLFRSEASSGRALSLTLQARSEDFATPGSILADNPFLYEAGIAYSQSLGEFQFISADYRHAAGRDVEPDRDAFRVTYGNRISSRANLTAEAFSETSNGRNNSGFRLAFIYRLGDNDSVTADYESGSEQVRLGYRRGGGSGVGAWNASIDADYSPSGSGANASLSRTENRFDWALTHSTSFEGPSGSASTQRSSARASTALLFADGTFGISRPVFDSFALVTPHKSLAGRQILVAPRDDTYSSSSGMFGAAAAVDLTAYSERSVTFNVPDAPAGYDLGAGNVRVYPPYRSGYKVVVGSDYTMTVIGRLINQDGGPLTLIAGTAIEVGAPDKTPLTVFTNRDGRFGLVGARPGKWLIKMPTTPPLEFEITVPDSPDSIARVGDITGNTKP